MDYLCPKEMILSSPSFRETRASSSIPMAAGGHSPETRGSVTFRNKAGFAIPLQRSEMRYAQALLRLSWGSCPAIVITSPYLVAQTIWTATDLSGLEMFLSKRQLRNVIES